MNKEIKVILMEDNNLKLTCDSNCVNIKKSTISSLDIYNLLDYNFGDTYIVSTEINGNKTSIVTPIKEMLEKVVDEINKMETPSELLKEDLNKLNDKEINESNNDL
ncbi:MAG: hypothetical protein RSC93_09890 [Erysipelotrichaceae bacterium]